MGYGTSLINFVYWPVNAIKQLKRELKKDTEYAIIKIIVASTFLTLGAGAVYGLARQDSKILEKNNQTQQIMNAYDTNQDGILTSGEVEKLVNEHPELNLNK